MSLVGIAMTGPTIAFLLLGGVVSDRFDRRRAMLAADVARGLAIGAIAVLSLTGALQLWHARIVYRRQDSRRVLSKTVSKRSYMCAA